MMQPISHSQPPLTGRVVRQAPLQTQQATELKSEPELPSGYRLKVGDKEFEVPANRHVSVGRLPSSDFTLDESEISREHALLHARNGQLQVCDRGSANGTYLDGKRLEPNRWYPVKDEASLRFSGLEATRTSPHDSLQGSLPQPGVWVSQMPCKLLDGPPAGLGPSRQGLEVGLKAAAGLVAGPVGAALQGLQLKDLEVLAGKGELEKPSVYSESLGQAQKQLDQERGIVDLPKGVPTLVLSDIHARRDFLTKALNHEVGGEKVFDMLKQGKINLVCLGDGMHAEGRAQDRWNQVVDEAGQGKDSKALKEEMVEGLGTMKMVMDLKSEFPDNFHFIRGNHEDVNRQVGDFGKLALQAGGESRLVRNWLLDTPGFGEDFVDKYAHFEKSLPLLVRGEGFVASHSAPGGPLQQEQIQGREVEAFKQLAWSDNTKWPDNSPQLQERFQENLKEVGAEGSKWLVGHRAVNQGDYRSQFEGQLIQINDPNRYVAALVPAGGDFQPQRDVLNLG